MTKTQADFDAILDAILELDPDAFDVSICLASCSKDEPVPNFEILQLFDSLAKEFRAIAKFNLVKWKKDRSKSNRNLILHPYTTESKPEDYEAEYIDLDLPEFNTILAQLEPLNSLPSMGTFQEAAEFIDKLRFYVIILQAPNVDTLYFFRAYTPKRLLSRSRLFAITATHGQYNRVEIPMFLFDYDIDCLSQSHAMFVFKKANFQEMFRYFEMLRKFTGEILESIKSRNFIQNFDVFRSDCEGHLQKLAKLKNIAAKQYWQRITIENIKAVNAKRNLGVKFENSDGRERIVYDPTDKWRLLKLLDDDYLWSDMTGQSYEVTGKRELKQQGT